MGCFEPRISCLDVEAVNFDAAADEPCCCCCQYPKLRLKYAPLFDTLNWVPGVAYEYSPGRWFRLREAIFYLSEFRATQNGLNYSIVDTVKLSVRTSNGDTIQQTFTNDVLLLRRTQLDYTLGEFRASGTFSSIRFRVGLPEAAQRVLPALAPENHPLGQQPEELWLGHNRGFAAFRLILNRDTLSTTPADTLMFGPPEFPSKVLESPGLFYRESGYDFPIQLVINYRKLFHGVDLAHHDISAWKSKIWVNLDSALSVIPR